MQKPLTCQRCGKRLKGQDLKERRAWCMACVKAIKAQRSKAYHEGLGGRWGGKR